MKKIFDRRVMIKVDGWEEFEDTSIFSHLVYKEEEFENEDFSYRFETFEDAKKAIEEGWVMNAESTTTFFTNRPLLRFSLADKDFHITMTEKNFEPLEVKIVYVKKNNLSIKTVANYLSADDFCEYLRDRNIFSITL